MAKKAKKEEELGDTPEVVVEKDGVVLVNRDKRERAQIIVDLVSGKRMPKDTEEADRKERFSTKFAEAGVNAKSAGAVQFAYELLGGLVRTPQEQEQADESASKQRAKNKKRAVQEDK